MIKLLTLVFLSLLMLTACTPEQEVNAFVKGSFADIQQQRQGARYLIMFWSEDCVYCTKEFPLFSKMLEQYPDVTLITIATDPFLDKKIIQKTLASYDLQTVDAWVFADASREKLYFDIDPRWRGELPLTYFFDEQNVMTKKVGLLKQEDLTKWLESGVI